jgi:NAD(P)-dependent dehydrogenase (short-subunit alcohol dehydrogenase family)
VPLNRSGEADDIAKVAVFLASDDSSHVQGPEIPVDGGVTGVTFGALVSDVTRQLTGTL